MQIEKEMRNLKGFFTEVILWITHSIRWSLLAFITGLRMVTTNQLLVFETNLAKSVPFCCNLLLMPSLIIHSQPLLKQTTAVVFAKSTEQKPFLLSVEHLRRVAEFVKDSEQSLTCSSQQQVMHQFKLKLPTKIANFKPMEFHCWQLMELLLAKLEPNFGREVHHPFVTVDFATVAKAPLDYSEVAEPLLWVQYLMRQIALNFAEQFKIVDWESSLVAVIAWRISQHAGLTFVAKFGEE